MRNTYAESVTSILVVNSEDDGAIS